MAHDLVCCDSPVLNPTRLGQDRTTAQLRQIIRIFQPETVLGWHRQLVKCKWTYNPEGRNGRPNVDQKLEHLFIWLAKENRVWGYGKIQGGLDKLGYSISEPFAPSASMGTGDLLGSSDAQSRRISGGNAGAASVYGGRISW